MPILLQLKKKKYFFFFWEIGIGHWIRHNWLDPPYIQWGPTPYSLCVKDPLEQRGNEPPSQSPASSKSPEPKDTLVAISPIRKGIVETDILRSWDNPPL